jgi:hypothetical protein
MIDSAAYAIEVQSPDRGHDFEPPPVWGWRIVLAESRCRTCGGLAHEMKVDGGPARSVHLPEMTPEGDEASDASACVRCPGRSWTKAGPNRKVILADRLSPANHRKAELYSAGNTRAARIIEADPERAERLKALFVCAYHVGNRKGELRRLRWEQAISRLGTSDS